MADTDLTITVYKCASVIVNGKSKVECVRDEGVPTNKGRKNGRVMGRMNQDGDWGTHDALG